MEIKMYFDTYEELSECFKKWQRRLGLSDWFIGLALVNPEDMAEEDRAGESDVLWENMCGTISILKKEHMEKKDLIVKQPHEATLIHEMLHFKFLGFKEKNRDEAFFEVKQHQLLDELARALFLAEYNLQPDWFVKKEDKSNDNTN